MAAHSSSRYYDRLYRLGRDAAWDEAPGKCVILSGVDGLVTTPPARVLDIGCGSGYFLDRVRSGLPVSASTWFFGVDISPEAIKKAQAWYADLTFLTMDAEALAFEDNAFDLVLSYGVLEHVCRPHTALDEVRRVLMPGGHFFLLLPSLDHYRDDRTDEGWYPDTEAIGQPQWNFLRSTWEAMFRQSGLHLFDMSLMWQYGARNPGVFYWGGPDPMP